MRKQEWSQIMQMRNLLSSLVLASFGNVSLAQDIDRDPSALNPVPVKRLYPGGMDEESLRVQASIPDTIVKTDTRGIQKEVFKSLYNQELKDEAHAPPMEE